MYSRSCCYPPHPCGKLERVSRSSTRSIASRHLRLCAWRAVAAAARLAATIQAREAFAAMEGRDMRVVDYVQQHAASQPQAVAVTCHGDTTYAQLVARMDAIAHVLLQQDVKKGEYVGVMLERCARSRAGRAVERRRKPPLAGRTPAAVCAARVHAARGPLEHAVHCVQHSVVVRSRVRSARRLSGSGPGLFEVARQRIVALARDRATLHAARYSARPGFGLKPRVCTVSTAPLRARAGPGVRIVRVL